MLKIAYKQHFTGKYGLEGDRSTGLGTYGESLMLYVWYNSLSDDLKNHLIIDASRTTHFFWHIYTRMNCPKKGTYTFPSL